MATISEDYISFEIAKLLKEKGFDVKCDKCYAYFADDDIRFLNLKYPKSAQLLIENRYPCITLQMAIKWLRIEHDIHIELNWDKGNQLYSFQIWKLEKFQPEISSLDLWRIYKDDNYIGEWNYEQACEEAIKYCLEHLI